MKKEDAKVYYRQLQKEAIPCPVCENSTHYSIYDNDRYGMGISTVICSHCGLVYLNPRPTEAEMSEFYKHSYRKYYEAIEVPTPEYIANGPFLARAEFVLSKLSPYLEQKNEGKLLDVGCAEGTLLQTVKTHFPQLSTYGIEPSLGFGQYAEKHSQAQVFVGTYQDFFAQSAVKAFDFIVTTHVLEHILDPRSFMQALHQYLSDDGLIYVEVPNVINNKKGISAHLGHVVSYDPDTLSSLVNACGFEVVDMYTEGLPALTPSMGVICRKRTDGSSLEISALSEAAMKSKIDYLQKRVEYTNGRARQSRYSLQTLKRFITKK
ncbi:MAG: methyltransferase domain-containing protein [Bacteroidota bacterium]